MNTRLALGRIAGIPIYLDMMFVLVVVILSAGYFTSGNSQLISAGFIIIAGLFVSILLHELGHAFAGRLFGQGVSHIELTGLGGYCQFERSLPRSVLVRTVVYLAGPAANLLLWLACDWLAQLPEVRGRPMLRLAVATIAISNFYLLLFNLLPAYPLDGGHTLDAWLGPIFGAAWSVRIVAVLGILTAGGIGYLAFPYGFWLLFLALLLLQANFAALRSVRGWGGG